MGDDTAGNRAPRPELTPGVSADTEAVEAEAIEVTADAVEATADAVEADVRADEEPADKCAACHTAGGSASPLPSPLVP